MVKSLRRRKTDRVATRGRALYAARIRPQLGGEKKGRVVAVDVDSADYEVADGALAAAKQLLARRPKADIWLERIGYPALRRIGGWRVCEFS